MAEKIGRAVLEISVDDQQYKAALDQVVQDTKKTTDTIKGIGLGVNFLAIKEFAQTALQGVQMVTEAVIELGTRGAAVVDVADAFDQLTAHVGEASDVMLSQLRGAVGGTMSDLDLMRIANKALGAGLQLNARDMAALAAGAKMLADRVGGDTKDAFDALTRAMITGRTTGLAEFGFKAKDGAAVLGELKAQLEAAGPAALDFADYVDISRSTVENLHNALGVVTARALPDLVAQFRNVGLTMGDFSTAATTAMNFVANGIVNAAAIGVNAITGLVQGVQAAASSIGAQAEQMWGMLTGKVGIQEGLQNVFALAQQGVAGLRDGITLALNPTVQWKDYLAQVGTTAVTVHAAVTNLATGTTENNARIVASESAKNAAMSALRAQEAAAAAAIRQDLETQTTANLQRLAALHTNFYVQTIQMATAAGFQTRGELEATAATAEETYQRMLQSGLYTDATLAAAHAAAEAAKQTAKGETVKYEMDQNQALASGSLQILSVLGQKYKAAAIAGAIISTYQAIAKALSSAPWPANLVLAAGAAAAGWANVSKIRSSDPGYATGTPGLDFANFGAETLTTLHRNEAVIPQGSGHLLAGEIATAMPQQDDGQSDRLERIAESLDRLPLTLTRAWRNAMATA